MSWARIRGHQQIIRRFQSAVQRDRLGQTYLFVGPRGVGKRTFANALAQALLCEARRERELAACGQCRGCLQVAASTHPDLLVVEKPADKNAIPLELFIGDRDSRMREGLCHDIALKSFCGGKRVAIIDDADYLNQQGANALLKTLEEPPNDSVLILIGTSLQRQLPTIRSRSQIVRFGPLQCEQVAEILTECQMVEDETEAKRLAEFSQGSVARALALADPEVMDFRGKWLSQLATHDPGESDFNKQLGDFVEAAGKDGAARRERLRLACDMAIQFYQQLMNRLAGSNCQTDSMLDGVVEQARASFSGDAETASDLIDRCLDVQQQINANANQATLIDCWLSDLGRISRREESVV